MQQINRREKISFFLKNMLKGLLWFAILIIAYLIIKNWVAIDYSKWLEPIFSNTFLIFSVYSLSELIFGIIPPELFMMWALRTGSVLDYSFYILLFAIISYIAGLIGFLFGAYLNTTVTYRFIRRRFLGKYHPLLQKYGAFLILVSALTPLPYSGISMLVGSFHYPLKKYLFWALSRFIRFGVYAFIIWKANML